MMDGSGLENRSRVSVFIVPMLAHHLLLSE